MNDLPGRRLCFSLNLSGEQSRWARYHSAELWRGRLCSCIEGMADFAAAFLVNPNHYLTPDGTWDDLVRLLRYDKVSHVPLILDGRWSYDDMSTNQQVAAFAQQVHASAVTVCPYPGLHLLQPFLDAGLRVYVQTLTADPRQGMVRHDRVMGGGNSFTTNCHEVVTEVRERAERVDQEDLGILMAGLPHDVGIVRGVAREDIPLVVYGPSALEFPAATISAARHNGGSRNMIVVPAEPMIESGVITMLAETARVWAAGLHELSDPAKAVVDS